MGGGGGRREKAVIREMMKDCYLVLITYLVGYVVLALYILLYDLVIVS